MTLSKSLSTVTGFSKILAGVLFVALPFLGFFLGMNYQASITESSQMPPVPLSKTSLTKKATPTIAIDETAKWETYSSPLEDNGLLKVSIKYPDSWRFNQVRYGQPFPPGYGFTVEDSTNNNIINLVTFAPVTYKTNNEYLTNSKNYLIDSQEINFQTIKAIKGLYPWSKEAEQIVEIFFVKDGSGYIIQERYKKAYENISSLPISNPNIVSTFKLLGQK